MGRSKLLVFLLIGIFMISFCSALSFDNVKYSKDKTFDGKNIKGNELLEKYKPIEIKNSFGFGKKLFEVYLSQHDDVCGQDCKSTMQIKLHEDGVLVDDVIFETLQNDGSWIEQDVRSYQFSYWGDIDDYETQCKIINKGEECIQVKVGSHKGWVNYQVGQEVETGTYELKLDAEKKPSRTVDWKIITQGKLIEELAIWGNISEGDDAEVILNSPEDDYILDFFNVQFNCSANITGGATLVNMSLWTNESGSWSASETARILTLDHFLGTSLNTTIWTPAYNNGGSVNVANSNVTLYAYDNSGGTSTASITNNSILNGENSMIEIYIPRIKFNRGTEGSVSAYARITYGGQTIMQRSVSSSSATHYNITVQIKNESSSFNYRVHNSTSWTNWSSFAPSNDNLAMSVYSSLQYTWTYVYFDIDQVEIKSSNIQSDLLTDTNFDGAWNRTITDTTLWTCQACDSDGDCGFAEENRTLYIDTAGPTINVSYPSGTINFGEVGENQTLNWTISDTNLDSCWYDYNGTNVSVACGDNTTNFLVEDGDTNLIFYANDSVSNLNSETISWGYKILVNNFIYNNETRAGDQEDFSLNITLGSGYDLISTAFIYEGEEYTTEIYSSGQERIINVSDFAIPLYIVNTNATLYFSFILDDATNINTTEETQLIYAMFLDNCSVYTHQLFNISLYDEALQTLLLGDIEFDYKLLNKPAYNEVNNLNMSFTNVTNVAICSDIDLTDQNFAQSIEIRYGSTGYASELYHIQKADITSDITTLNLYDLNLSDSTEFKVTYQDDTFNFIEGAIVQLQRKYISEGVYKIVEAPLTSNEGVAILHIDLDSVKYRATVVKDGVTLDEFDNLVFRCQSELTGECEQKLLGEIDPSNDISIEATMDFSYSLSKIDNTITLAFSIPSGLPSSINMQMTQKDQFGDNEMCNNTITSSAGSIQCSYNDTIGDSYIDLEIYKNGKPVVITSYIILEDSDMGFFGNNYIVVVVLLLSIVGMALTSPEWIIINGIMVMVISGALWLINGLDFVVGLGNLMWLVIAAGILIFKLAKQEDR